jgi:predicted MFS family arabinose efflux permease
VSTIAGRGVQLLLLTAAMAAIGYIRTAISPLQEAMRVALSLSDNQMALLQGAVIAIPVTLAAIPLGLLIDRYSRVRLLMVLVWLSLLGNLLTAFASDFTLLVLARGLAGVTGLGIIPVVFSLLADLYPPEQRGRVTTVVFIGQVGGNSAAFALGGLLLAMAGTQPDDGWRWAMLWLNAPLVPIAFLVLALREPPRKGVAIANPSVRQVWHELRHYRVLVGVLAIGIVLVEMAVGAMFIWGAPMLSRNFGLPPDSVGGIMAMGMLVSGVLGPIVGGTLADYYRPERACAAQRTSRPLRLCARRCISQYPAGRGPDDPAGSCHDGDDALYDRHSQRVAWPVHVDAHSHLRTIWVRRFAGNGQPAVGRHRRPCHDRKSLVHRLRDGERDRHCDFCIRPAFHAPHGHCLIPQPGATRSIASCHSSSPAPH